MKKLAVEFIGTFILVFTIGNAAASQTVLAPLAVGLAYMIAIYGGRHVSGAHYNPAVSIAVWRRGKLSTLNLLFYFGAQFAGAIVAAILVKMISGEATARALTALTKLRLATDYKPVGNVAIFMAEMIWTAVLGWVVLSVTTTKASQDRPYYGIAIGATVVVGITALGSISGGVCNPASQIGMAIMNLKEWASILVFWPAQIVGALLAPVLFRLSTSDD